MCVCVCCLLLLLSISKFDPKWCNNHNIFAYFLCIFIYSCYIYLHLILVAIVTFNTEEVIILMKYNPNLSRTLVRNQEEIWVYLFQESKLVDIATHIAEQLLSHKFNFIFSAKAHLSSGNMLFASRKYIPFSIKTQWKKIIYSFTKVNFEVSNTIYNL